MENKLMIKQMIDRERLCVDKALFDGKFRKWVLNMPSVPAIPLAELEEILKKMGYDKEQIDGSKRLECLTQDVAYMKGFNQALDDIKSAVKGKAK